MESKLVKKIIIRPKVNIELVEVKKQTVNPEIKLVADSFTKKAIKFLVKELKGLNLFYSKVTTFYDENDSSMYFKVDCGVFYPKECIVGNKMFNFPMGQTTSLKEIDDFLMAQKEKFVKKSKKKVSK